MANENIQRIENDLLKLLLKYIVPFVDSKINFPAKKESRLENLVQKISISDVKSIEDIVKMDSDIKTKTIIQHDNLLHSFKASRLTSQSDEIFIAIKYAQKDAKESLSFESAFGNKKYSAETASENPLNSEYSLEIVYERKGGIEKISISYREQMQNYMMNHILEKEDMSNRVPLKWINPFSKNQMPGVLGFTYIGDSSMGRRDDLFGAMARMVDIHESIHTPDEYETRILTDWIMEKPLLKYKK